MKRLALLALMCGGAFTDLSAQNDQTLEFLKAEIQRTVRQRDEAQKKLLETESLSTDKVRILSGEQQGLQQRLNQTSREMLEMDASSRMAKAAMRRSESELAEREKQLQELRQQQDLSKQEIEARDQKIAAVEAGRQKNLNELHDLQQLNEKLTTDLYAAKLSESLANAKLAALESRLGSLQNQLAQQFQERSELEQERDQLQEVIHNLQGKLETADTNSRKLEEENGQLQKQLRDEQKNRGTLEKQIADLESVMKKAKKAGIQKDDLENVALLLAEMEREKESFHQESITHRKQVDQLQEELDNQQSDQRIQISELQNMLSRQMEEITTSQKKITALEARSATLDEVRLQKAQLMKHQEKSQEDMRTLAKHIYDLRSDLVQNRETQRKAILAIRKNQELANELEALRTEMEKVSRLNRSIVNQDSRKDDRIRELRLQLETGRAQSQALEREKRALLLELQKTPTRDAQ